MTNIKKREKRNLAIRTFLAANRGKKYTAIEIAEFLNENEIVDQYGFSGRELGQAMSSNWLSMKGVDREKKGNKIYYYWGYN